MPDAADKQLSLFAEIGVDALPEGASRLSTRELAFCLEYLRTGRVTHSAKVAGYSDPESDGSKIQKRPGVARFLASAGRSAAQNATALVTRAWQRSQALHADWQEERNKPEGRRSLKRETELAAQAGAADKLLGTLLGLDTLKLDVKGDLRTTLAPEELQLMRELNEGLKAREAAA